GLQTTGFAIYAPRFGGVLNIVRRKRDNNALHGKAAAVNAGIDLISGDLIFSMDADVVLAPDAIEKTVRALAGNPEMVAATGHLIIDSYLATEATHHEKTVIDENGIPISSEMNTSERALTAFQFIEYLKSFHLGRSAESITDTMFTLSGACAVFKRDILLNVGTFSGRTVSEDTDVTMAVQNLEEKQIGYLRDTHTHLAPTLSWADLDRKSTRLNSSHVKISYAVFCLKQKNKRRKGHCSRHRFAPAVHAGAAAPGDWPRRLRSASRPCCPLPYRGVQE